MRGKKKLKSVPKGGKSKLLKGRALSYVGCCHVHSGEGRKNTKGGKKIVRRKTAEKIERARGGGRRSRKKARSGIRFAAHQGSIRKSRKDWGNF